MRISILITLILVISSRSFGTIPCILSPDSSNIKYLTLNKRIDTAKQLLIDINEDGKPDLEFWLRKRLDGGYIESIAALAVPMNDKKNLDVIYDAVSDSLFPLVYNAPDSFIVSQNCENWYGTKNQAGSILLFSFKKYNPDNMIIENRGIYNNVEVKIPIRVYLKELNEGWHNGWIKAILNLEYIEIVCIAYHKQVEQSIKIGEI